MQWTSGQCVASQTCTDTNKIVVNSQCETKCLDGMERKSGRIDCTWIEGVSCEPGPGFTGMYVNNECVKTGCADTAKTLVDGSCVFANENNVCDPGTGFTGMYVNNECVKIGCTEKGKTLVDGSCVFANEKSECNPGPGFTGMYVNNECVKIGCTETAKTLVDGSCVFNTCLIENQHSDAGGICRTNGQICDEPDQFGFLMKWNAGQCVASQTCAAADFIPVNSQCVNKKARCIQNEAIGVLVHGKCVVLNCVDQRKILDANNNCVYEVQPECDAGDGFYGIVIAGKCVKKGCWDSSKALSPKTEDGICVTRYPDTYPCKPGEGRWGAYQNNICETYGCLDPSTTWSYDAQSCIPKSNR